MIVGVGNAVPARLGAELAVRIWRETAIVVEFSERSELTTRPARRTMTPERFVEWERLGEWSDSSIDTDGALAERRTLISVNSGYPRLVGLYIGAALFDFVDQVLRLHAGIVDLAQSVLGSCCCVGKQRDSTGVGLSRRAIGIC